MLKPGIIASVQGYSCETTLEMVNACIEAKVIGIRSDTHIDIDVPLIGLVKKNRRSRWSPYITPDVESISMVESWADYVAVDYRRCNPDLKEISDYCRDNKLNIIADICQIEDYDNIIENGYYYTYIATTLSVLRRKFKFFPAITLLQQLHSRGEKNIIAEGNYTSRDHVAQAYNYCQNICIGGAISGIYKNARKFTTVYP